MDYQLDIETLSTKKNAMIMSVGICQSDGLGSQIYVPKPTQIFAKRHVEKKTFDWWNEPERVDMFKAMSDKCLQAHEEGMTIGDVHDFIFKFLERHDDGEPRRIWMNSPAFDGVILESLFNYFKLDAPWHYRDPCCFRTLKKLAEQTQPFGIELPKEIANKHDALADCQWQMEATHTYLKVLGL